MKIIVCIKRVPDTAARIKVSDSGESIDPSGLKYVISPYDEFAIEAALRLKEEAEDAEVTVLTLGDAAAGEQLRSALAMGADRAVLLESEGTTMDGSATAEALAAALRDMDGDLILFGMKAVDGDQQQVGPMVAERLGRGCATVVAQLQVEGESVICHREVEGGSEIVEAALPAVVTITKGPHEPRYPSLKGIMAAKRKPLEEEPTDVPAGRIQVRELNEPPERTAGKIVGEGREAVPELMRLLREEAKVL